MPKLVSTTTSSTSTTSSKKTKKSVEEITKDLGYNLNVRPIHYTLKIELNHETDTFTGTVTIEVEFLESVKSFMVNAQDMDILTVKMTENMTENNEFKSVKMTEKMKFKNLDDQLIIYCDREKGNYQLVVEFTGDVSKKNEGFYVSPSRNDSVSLYSTHFEPSDARKAFPCFDHPNMKATFDIEITASEIFTILSNNTVQTESVNDGKRSQERKTKYPEKYSVTQ